jgi:hypothetical protein
MRKAERLKAQAEAREMLRVVGLDLAKPGEDHTVVTEFERQPDGALQVVDQVEPLVGAGGGS